MSLTPAITGIILAGGAGSRVGGQDKGLMTLQGQLMISHVSERVRRQVHTLVISCNRNPEIYHRFSDRIVQDLRPGFQGPLAGLEAAAASVSTEYALVAPCDTPYLPHELAARLWNALSKASDPATIAYAHDGQRAHYLCALLRATCLTSLEPFMNAGGRAVHEWFRQQGAVAVNFADMPSAFANHNRTIQQA
ncbi:MAG: molybdenum cofactor guanylyltransferase MobA [Pseudomonadota bacterium]